MGSGQLEQLSKSSTPSLPPAKPAEVERIHQRSPQQLQAKGPKDKAEECLVFIADALTLHDQGNAAGQSQGNALENIEEEEKQNVPQLLPESWADIGAPPVLRV